MGFMFTTLFFDSKMVIPVPTLSTQGWVTDTANKIDMLLAHYVSNDAEQSNTYQGNIASLQAIIEQHTGNPLDTADAICRSIINYLGRYYDNVMADASYALIDPKESQTTVKITLALNFTEAGVNYTANRLLTYFNGKFKSIVEANNG